MVKKWYKADVQYWGGEFWVSAPNKREARKKALKLAKKKAPIHSCELEEVEDKGCLF